MKYIKLFLIGLFLIIGTFCLSNFVNAIIIFPQNMTSNVLPTPYVSWGGSAPFDSYKAFDGNDLTNTEATNAEPYWIQIDLGSNYLITTAKNYSLRCGDNTQGCDVYSIEQSSNNINWYVVDSKTQNDDGSLHTFSFPNTSLINTRYWRLNVTYSRVNNYHWVHTWYVSGDIVSNSTITNSNNYNSASILNFTAVINGVSYNTTTGMITTPFLSNSTTLVNITIISNNMFNKTYTNYNISSNLLATQDQYPIIYLTNKWNNTNISISTIEIDGVNYSTTSTFIYTAFNTSKSVKTYVINYLSTTETKNLLQNTISQINISQSIINFSLKEFYNNFSLNNFTLNITNYGIPYGCNTSLSNNSWCLIYPNKGTYNYSVIDNTGVDIWTLVNNTFSVNYLDNKTINAYVTNHFINVIARNSQTNASISNFSINLTDLTDSSDIRYFNTTNGSILIPVIHHTYNLNIYTNDYVIQSKNVTVNTSITSNSIINTTFYLFKVNSLLFKIYDILTLGLINNSNSTIFMQGTLNTYTMITSNGTSYQEVASDVYRVTVSNPSYANSFQTATLTGSEHLDMNFYMTNTSNLFQFFAISNIGTDNGNKISGATCTFYFPNNGSTLTVGSFITDFSGSGTIYLDVDKTYTFICQADGYVPFQDIVKPIVASNPYSVFMTSTGGTPFTSVLNGLIISTSMSYSYPSTTSYFFYTLNSVNGTTEYFGMSTVYNGTTFIINNTGSTSGGLLTMIVTPLNLVNRSITVTYWYKVVGYNYQTWNQTFYLPVIRGGNMTLSQGIFTGNNSITDFNSNPMNPIDLGLLALLIPIFLMLFMHMFGMPKIIVILAGLAGDGIIIMSNMFSAMPNSAKIMTVLGMSMTIIFMFLIADNKDSVGLN